jgi:hypothetical protein
MIRTSAPSFTPAPAFGPGEPMPQVPGWPRDSRSQGPVLFGHTIVASDGRRREPIRVLSGWPAAASRPRGSVLFGHTVVGTDSHRRAA